MGARPFHPESLFKLTNFKHDRKIQRKFWTNAYYCFVRSFVLLHNFGRKRIIFWTAVVCLSDYLSQTVNMWGYVDYIYFILIRSVYFTVVRPFVKHWLFAVYSQIHFILTFLIRSIHNFCTTHHYQRLNKEIHVLSYLLKLWQLYSYAAQRLSDQNASFLNFKLVLTLNMLAN